MNKKLFGIFLGTLLIYYLLATRGTFTFPYDLDYFNPLAKSFLSGRLDIPQPIVTYDLSSFGGKWYPYWGPLPAILLIPAQLLKGRFVPTIYLSLVFAAINAVVMALLVSRFNRDFLRGKASRWLMMAIVLVFLLGTSQIFVGTKSGVWYVSQVVSLTPSLLAFYLLTKKKLRAGDYFLSSFLISLNFLGRISLVGQVILLALRILDDKIFLKEKTVLVVKKLIFAVIPFTLFLVVFMIYNAARFSGPFDTGYLYHNLSHLDAQKYLPYGIISPWYIPRNLWLIFLEFPKLTLSGKKIVLDFNHEGMSIFFTTPFYLAALLTLRKSLFDFRDFPSRLVVYLWVSFICLLIPTLFLFSPGLYQFGIRYSLDFSMILLVLALIGLGGKANILVFLAAAISISLNVYSLFVFG